MGMTDFTREEVVEIVHTLEKADLTGIDLNGVSLRGANLSGASRSKATYDKETKFPRGFDPEKNGVVLVE